jgi:hypothetical protein
MAAKSGTAICEGFAKRDATIFFWAEELHREEVCVLLNAWQAMHIE